MGNAHPSYRPLMFLKFVFCFSRMFFRDFFEFFFSLNNLKSFGKNLVLKMIFPKNDASKLIHVSWDEIQGVIVGSPRQLGVPSNRGHKIKEKGVFAEPQNFLTTFLEN